MSIYSDYEHGCLTDEEYRFLANRENRKEREEEENARHCMDDERPDKR